MAKILLILSLCSSVLVGCSVFDQMHEMGDTTKKMSDTTKKMEKNVGKTNENVEKTLEETKKMKEIMNDGLRKPATQGAGRDLRLKEIHELQKTLTFQNKTGHATAWYYALESSLFMEMDLEDKNFTDQVRRSGLEEFFDTLRLLAYEESNLPEPEYSIYDEEFDIGSLPYEPALQSSHYSGSNLYSGNNLYAFAAMMHRKNRTSLGIGNDLPSIYDMLSECLKGIHKKVPSSELPGYCDVVGRFENWARWILRWRYAALTQTSVRFIAGRETAREYLKKVKAIDAGGGWNKLGLAFGLSEVSYNWWRPDWGGFQNAMNARYVADTALQTVIDTYDLLKEIDELKPEMVLYISNVIWVPADFHQVVSHINLDQIGEPQQVWTKEEASALTAVWKQIKEWKNRVDTLIQRNGQPNQPLVDSSKPRTPEEPPAVLTGPPTPKAYPAPAPPPSPTPATPSTTPETPSPTPTAPSPTPTALPPEPAQNAGTGGETKESESPQEERAMGLFDLFGWFWKK